MESKFSGPVNIGSDEMVTINRLVKMVMEIAKKKITIKHISGPLGVRGRNSDNRLILEKLGWSSSRPLREGLEKTYSRIEKQVIFAR
jgi:nucleoside-diphosphate-sugar epimerase